MPEKTYISAGVAQGQTPKVGNSVQKSRSFGGLNKQSEGQDNFLQEHGRRTPNLGSLRKKFVSSKKFVSLDECSEVVTNNSGKNKNKNSKSKVSNLFKWFRKDKDDSKLSHLKEEDPAKPKETSPKHTANDDSHMINRSASYDSVCSIGSVSNSSNDRSCNSNNSW